MRMRTTKQAEVNFAKPARWTPATLSEAQHRFFTSQCRINTVHSGRRSFKTEGAKRRLVLAAMAFTRYPNGRFWAAAPTQMQAKKIFWDDLKQLVPTFALYQQNPDSAISESELTIRLWNTAIINVVGFDKPQRIEGQDWDGGVVTEYGNCKPNVFFEIIRPMMTRGGYIDIEGVPEGRNHFYELVQMVKSGRIPDSANHHWRTDDVLHLWLGKKLADEELSVARATMDALTYRQEYGGEFVGYAGYAYYAFNRQVNLVPDPHRIGIDSAKPLIACYDFNRTPGVLAVIQEIPAPKWLSLAKKIVVAIIDEIFIPKNSNTPMITKKFLDRYSQHPNEVWVYGDPSGGAKTTQSVAGSDYDMIDQLMRNQFGNRYQNRVAHAAPLTRVRLNAVNSVLNSVDGHTGLVVNPHCTRTIMDFEGVECDDEGNVIKEKGSLLTHMSDAIGYYIHERFPFGAPLFEDTYRAM